MSSKVNYAEQKVELSREYPFGETNETTDGKKITVLRVKELNGHDDVVIDRETSSGKLMGYVQIAVATGITYDEALMLARKDSDKIVQVMENF